MKSKNTQGVGALLLFAAGALCFDVQATELVYVPTNPSFGGNPMYGSHLLGSAQATKKHKEASPLSARSFGEKSALDNFNASLERSILSQLASSATSQIIANGKLVPGTVETNNFRIVVVDSGGGMLTITTTDKVTGASTTFQVQQQW